MKKIILSVSFSFLATTGAFAQSLDQQIAVTRDSIARLSMDLQTRDASSGGLELSDYRPWEQAFKARMEKYFEIYEQEMSVRVFGPLKQILTKAYAVADDKNMPDYQRKSLLGAYENQLKGMVGTIKDEYHKLLLNLYHSNNVIPNIVRSNGGEIYYGRGYFKVKKKKNASVIHQIINHSLKYFDGKNSPSKVITLEFDSAGYGYNLADSREMPTQKIATDLESMMMRFDYRSTHKRIIEGCHSKACLIMKASDIVFVHESIFALLDKDIVISVPKGDGQVSSVIIPALKPTLINNLIQRSDFPAELEALPFDI